jgi:drug/metabolite transporter (DMT)-like permease
LVASWATVFTYGFALLLVALRYRARVFVKPPPIVLLIGLAAGAANIGFLIAAIYGQVARVVLLFYLAPVWTVAYAWWLLGERPTRLSLCATAIALAGAAVMLWNPAQGIPVPANPAEWLALASGLSFALANVLIRKAGDVPIELRSFHIFAGCVVLGLLAALVLQQPLVVPQDAVWVGVLGLLTGLVMLLCNWIVQYGLVNVSANRAIVIYLSELVFAAVSAWLLAGEALGWKELAGGMLIVTAGVLAARRG